FTVLML
ncbi:hypothetical protein CFOL_v3_24683, partial [Cephalotus follicularis]